MTVTTTQKPRISLGDFASLWIAASFAIFIGSVTYVVLALNNDAVTQFASRPLYPGFYIAYLLVRGHTDRADPRVTLAVFAAVSINAIVYAVGVLIIRLLWRYISNPSSLQPHKFAGKDSHP
jgi:hypothetical protein